MSFYSVSLTPQVDSPALKATLLSSESVKGTNGIYSDYYKTMERIGLGSFAIVRRCVSLIDNKSYAVKIIKKCNLHSSEIKLLKQEIRILKQLSHKNIIKLYDVFEDEKYVKLILDLCNKDDLFAIIANCVPEKNDLNNIRNEKLVANIILNLANGLNYLHSNGIVHRDLKPENILIKGNNLSNVVIADFGLSSQISTQLLKTKCGTPNYVAPEILTNDTYDYNCDYWSLGVILYVLLSGLYPFFADNAENLYEQIIGGKFTFKSPRWNSVSYFAKDLINKLLEIDYNKRYKFNDIINHPFIQNNIPKQVLKINNNITNQLLFGYIPKFNGKNKTTSINNSSNSTSNNSSDRSLTVSSNTSFDSL